MVIINILFRHPWFKIGFLPMPTINNHKSANSFVKQNKTQWIAFIWKTQIYRIWYAKI